MSSSFRHRPPFPKQLVGKMYFGGNKWGKVRRQHLISNPFCSDCMMMAEEVHHNVPRHVDPSRTYDPTNLVSLCHRCHMKRHESHG